MRTIGHLPDEAQARRFGDYLLASGIPNEVERDSDTEWTIWIVEEEKIASAQSLLEWFRRDPGAAEFQSAHEKAAQVRAAQAKELADYQRRVRTRKSLFPTLGGHGVGILTYSIIFVCVIVAFRSKGGGDREFLQRWFISDPSSFGDGLLPEVRSGEVWRLITPIFIHFGALHLLFNMMWMYFLGSMIEARQSWKVLAGLVLAFGVCSNFAQYVLVHPSFGGMSGVNYGLAGYAWMRGDHDRASGLFLGHQNKVYLVVWMVICFLGWVGPVANIAHLAGFLAGLGWGRVSASLASRRPES